MESARPTGVARERNNLTKKSSFITQKIYMSQTMYRGVSKTRVSYVANSKISINNNVATLKLTGEM